MSRFSQLSSIQITNTRDPTRDPRELVTGVLMGRWWDCLVIRQRLSTDPASLFLLFPLSSCDDQFVQLHWRTPDTRTLPAIAGLITLTVGSLSSLLSTDQTENEELKQFIILEYMEQTWDCTLILIPCKLNHIRDWKNIVILCINICWMNNE